MTGNKLVDGYQSKASHSQPSRSKRDVPRAQEAIYSYLLEIVKTWSAEDVLAEFKHLFIHHVNTISSHTVPLLYEIIFSNQEQEFRNTLKRSCYILINNWDITRNHKSIQHLIQLFDDPILNRSAASVMSQRLRNWIRAFIKSKDFQELQLFAARYEERENIHWSQRYASYLLVPQYIDLKNPIEQRQAAKTLSKQLKDKFKFDLAMYTARSDVAAPAESTYKNPTALGDEALRLVKLIVAKRGMFSYANFANIFINQTQHLPYRDFKKSLQKYLIFSVEHHEYTQALKAQLLGKLNVLYTTRDDQVIDDALLLRTCNRVIEYLTTENHVEPSPLFVLLLSHGNPLTLVIVLLKIVLICKYSRTHLEARIANLIAYYQEFPEEECRWVINFFEIFRVIMAIYTENIEFNLVNMNPAEKDTPPDAKLSQVIDAYRIFSQPKQTPQPERSPSATEESELEASLSELDDSFSSSPIPDSQGAFDS
ncbi:hypothetical protein H6G89_06615 [Oscillatoria sp. FACHB-1407]|uniref:hypothetical protein n=1 Tax=Oscillatoria sp. FACHB-1407 TaxID=2692847 RepID=UPI001686C3E4|nr:hypothetical protein [Oscillatoria sp. FACHB-1407]MBD2460712.1 hypothetical protein [Oscillatoria sp. FACHB-1407]